MIATPAIVSAAFLATACALVGEEKKSAEDSASVSFSKEIAPILVKKCVTCHGPEKSKGGFRLDTFEFLMKGGESKSPAISPGKADRSKLYELITAEDEDDRMPQKDDPLPAGHIGLIERWIKDGAKFDGADPKAPLVTLIPKAPHPDPPAAYRHPLAVTALAFNLDGQRMSIQIGRAHV